jgi:type VI secretion system ImpA family protein
MLALCESFWDALHPRVEAGDTEFRIAPVVWLNRKLPTDVRLLPITEPEADGIPSCTLADWEAARQMENLQHRPGQQAAPGGSQLAKFQQSAMLTPTRVLAERLEDVRDFLQACAALQVILDEKLGAEAPGLLSIRSAGEEAATLLESLLRERGALQVRQSDDSPTFQYQYSEPEEQDPEPSRVPVPGRIRTRSEAYQMLAEAAEFLNRTEPHSPAPYLIRRAISWGSMSLEELLPELIRNQSELTEINRLLNVRIQGDTKK